MTDANFTYEELLFAVQESLELAKQKPDTTKAWTEYRKAVNKQLELLGLDPHFKVIDETDSKISGNQEEPS